MNDIIEKSVPEACAPEKESEASVPEPEPVLPEKEPIIREAAILLVLSFLAAGWYWFGHDFDYGMGVGLTVSHWMLTAAVLILANARKALKITPEGFFLLILSLLLSAAYGIYANIVMKWLNLPVLLLVSAQALFSLTAHNRFSPLSGQGLWEGFRRYFISLFRCWVIPFRALARRKYRKDGQPKTEQVLVGLIVAAFAAVLALVILSSADEVFSGMMTGAAEQLGKIDGIFIVRILFSFPLGMLLFSHRASLFRPKAEINPVNPTENNPTVFRMVLAALAAVYGLFSYVQIRYLFAGVESVRMSGGYAAYARSGFFQLVLVALLTLCLIIPALALCKKDKPVRILCAAVAALTIVIDVSAFFRMRLYIDAYGLTTLRIVTLWGIGMILLALAASTVKSFLPDLKTCPVLAAIALSTWIGLSFANIDRIVAENQVSRFNEEIRQGAWQSADTAEWDKRISALASDQYWSPDYYAAFEKIEDPQARSEALDLLETRAAADEEVSPDPARQASSPEYRKPLLYDWNLSWLKVPHNQ